MKPEGRIRLIVSLFHIKVCPFKFPGIVEMLFLCESLYDALFDCTSDYLQPGNQF